MEKEVSARGPALSVLDIHSALAKVRNQGLVNIRVNVDWHLYRDLLIIRKLPHDPADRDTWGRNYERRPIKTFDGEELILTNDAAIVLGENAVGEVSGWAIPGRI